MNQVLAKIFAFFLVILLSSLSHAGEWVRNSDSSISFSGEIEKDELSRFLAIYKSTDRTLVLSSSGGNNQSALKIAEILIENKNLTVVVRGMCASSCANYLFLAGHVKQLDHGVVGFHGSWGAYVASSKFKKEIREVPADAKDRLLKYHMDGAEEEAKFLAKAGVKQELFDRTQKENDDGLYDIYLPGPRALEYYGIHGVRGSQDLSVLNAWPNVKIQYDDGPTQYSNENSIKGLR